MKRKKLMIGLLGGVVSLAIMLSLVMLPAPAAASGSLVNIDIMPTPYTAVVNEVFTVDIQLTAGEQQVRGADVHIDFNTTYLEVQDIIPGTTLGLVILNEHDNTIGTIDYSAGNLTDWPSGTFTLATIQFKAKAITTSTPLAFVFDSSHNRITDVRFGGHSVLGVATDGAVVMVSGSTLAGYVFLQDRPTPPDDRWVTDLTVTVLEAGKENVVATYTPTTNNNGEFSIFLDGVPLGTYDIRVKGSHTLSSKVNGVVVDGGTIGPKDCGTLLEGDADGNNMINIADFDLLAGAYRSMPGDANWDARCDFNNDGRINIADFDLLAGNYKKMGE